ncbi:MAG TPA: response regulator [Longimicrobium sp.]|nr:response regulator [Longimicrobium sp.]
MPPKRILVVDDEDDIREVAQLSLEMIAGWEVIPARSGEEGIRRAAEERPDAILLDVMMPDLDGPATFRRLRDDPATASIPVLLLTARAQAGDRERLEGLGVAGVLAKPFDPMELARQVSDALGWPG